MEFTFEVGGSLAAAAAMFLEPCTLQGMDFKFAPTPPITRIDIDIDKQTKSKANQTQISHLIPQKLKKRTKTAIHKNWAFCSCY